MKNISKLQPERVSFQYFIDIAGQINKEKSFLDPFDMLPSVFKERLLVGQQKLYLELVLFVIVISFVVSVVSEVRKWTFKGTFGEQLLNRCFVKS